MAPESTVELVSEIKPEFEVNPRSVVIATTTLYSNWYPGEAKSIADTDKIRGDLALRFVRVANERGYKVVIADGDSSQGFKEELSKLNVIILPRATPKRAAGRRQVFKKAVSLSEVKVIIYTQPEKVSLVEDCAQIIAAPIVRGEADIIVPKRNKELFQETYPDYYHDSEVKANGWYNRILHKFGLLSKDQELDIFFGVFAFRNDLSILPLFLEKYEYVGPKDSPTRKYIDPEEVSDAHVFPIVEGLKKGLRVLSVEVPFRYAEEQKKNEETPSTRQQNIKKRREQRLGFLGEEIQFIRYLTESPKGKLRPQP